MCKRVFSLYHTRDSKFINKKPLFLLVLLIILVCASFYFFSDKEDNIPDEVLSFYDNFLTTYTEGTFSDIDSLLYYQRPAYWKLTEDDFSNLTHYEIKKWEQINSNLWVVKIYLETGKEPDGYLCHHFVGYIDDKLYVMIGVYQIPDSLSGGEDLSRFIPRDVLPADDTIIFS